MGMKYNFINLEIWNLLRELASRIYAITIFYPRQEQFGLTNQMQLLVH